MTRERFADAFENAILFTPTEELMDRAEAAQKVGMDDDMLLECIAYEAGVARTLGRVYEGAYGAERGREKAAEVVYRRMVEVWRQRQKQKEPPP